MRVPRVLIGTLIFIVGLSGALPGAALAQDDAGSNPMIYLPALRNNTAQQTPTGSNGLVTADVPATEQAATARFWTRERMLSAQSLDRLVVDGAVGTGANAQRDAGRPGPKGAVAGSLPDRGSLALAQSLYAEEWARMAADDAAIEATGLALPSLAPASADDSDTFASVPPFASYYVNDNAATWKSFPWITMGRLFFQIPGLSGTYACSGAVAYGRAVWTAGHCVFTTGRGWNYNMYFVPAYRNGAWPYGSFTVKSRTALSQWVSGANLAYNIGMVAVNDKSGLKLSQWVGSVGFMWNQSATQLFHAFGYPTNYSSAQYLVTCAAGTYTRDPLAGPDPIGIGCDMGSGSSGGPWMVGYAPFKGGLTNYINGVASYSYSTRPLEIFSPYFGTEAKTLYDWGRAQ